MQNSAYLIAKYIPDLFRNEPKNIGIILWSNGLVHSRFLGEQLNGAVDGRTVSGVINSVSSYKQWVSAWQKMLRKDQIKQVGSKHFAAKTSFDFVKILQKTGTGNYVLERGGELFEEVNESNIFEVTDYLFKRLVQSKETEENAASIAEIRDQFLQDAQIENDNRVQISPMIPCEKNGKTVRHEFHFGIGNGQINCIAQLIGLGAPNRSVKEKLDTAAWRFKMVREFGKTSGKVSENARFLALTYLADGTVDPFIEESLTELEFVDAEILDIYSNRKKALETIQDIVSRTKHH